MSRVASEGLVLTCEKKSEVSIIEINSETDFVAKIKILFLFLKKFQRLILTVKVI